MQELPFADDSFEQVTAFETIYFWPNLEEAFQQVFRVLKPGGSFLVCNESNGEDPKQEKWCDIIGGMTIYTGERLFELLWAAGFYSSRDPSERGSELAVCHSPKAIGMDHT